MKQLPNLKNLFKNRLFVNAVIYILADVINKAVPFLLLPILTIYLIPSDYGVVATYGAFIAIAAVFIHLSMSGSVTIQYFKMPKEALRIYIGNVLIIVAFTTFLAFAVVLVFHEGLSAKLEIPHIWLTAGILVSVAQFLTLLNLALWQAEQNPRSFAAYQISQTLASYVLIIIFVVVYKMGWEGQLLGQSIAAVLFAVISFIFIYHRGFLVLQVERKYIEKALRFGIPLVPHTLSGWFKTGVDRIFLTTILGTTATGLYAVGYQFGMIIGILALAFNNAYVPYLFKKLTKNSSREKRKLVLLTYLYFVAILVIATIISISVPWIIETFLDKRYFASVQFVSWIAFGYAFQGMYFMVVNYIFYLEKTQWLVPITLLGGLFHVALSYVLINKNGAIGAAQATTISFFITFLFVWVLSSKLYPMPWALDLFSRKAEFED